MLEFIDKQIKIGDLLTSITLLISMISILYTLRKERILHQREQADRVRKAAAQTIAKLDRWSELSLSLFQDIDAIFVKASNELKENDFDRQSARDFLWVKLNLTRDNMIDKKLNENIETAYVDLCIYDPLVRAFFQGIFTRLKDEEEIMFNSLLEGIQVEIDRLNIVQDRYQTSSFLTPLKIYTDKIYEIYIYKISNIMSPINEDMLNIISRSDNEIFSVKRPFFQKSLMDLSPLDSEIYKINAETEILYGKI